MKRIDAATDPRVEDLGRRLPEILYRYMRVDSGRLEWVKRLIVDGELFFAPATAFNDPFDCQIAPSFDGTLDEIRAYVCDVMEREGRTPAGNEDEINSRVAKCNTREFHEDAARRYVALIRSYGISCFTAAPTNMLMWSYYAAGHTGVVVGIDTLKLAEQRLGASHFPLDVQYAREFPEARYYTDDDFDIARKTLGTEADVWQHEQEWRWILIGKSGAVRLAPGTVSVLIFGVRTPPETEESVRRWIQQSGQAIRVFRIANRPNTFLLEVDPA
jgi:hypothetical protein